MATPAKTPPRRFLVVLGTQRVKGYLFASPFLRETRGASLLLDRLNRVRTQRLAEEAGGDVVFLGGGSGQVLFSDREAAEGFAHRVRSEYGKEAPGSRVVAEVIERGSEETFPDWVARGVGECRRRKLGRSEAVPLVAGRWIRPCTSCGVEPAASTSHDVQGTHHLCPSCEHKRTQIRKFYRQAKPRREEVAELPSRKYLEKHWPGSVFTTLAERFEYTHPGATLELPTDFDAIGHASRPSNYTALIYADGNRMGETVRRIAEDFPDDAEARAAYQTFSEITDRSTREAAVRALMENVLIEEEGEKADRARLPAELVLAGGDDLVLVVPAHTALPVAVRFLQLFQETSLRLQEEAKARDTLSRLFAPDGLTVSGGIVFAHASFPASQALELAGELMKSAKRRAADLARQGHDEGTLDFLVLHESGTESALERRREEYETRRPSGLTVHRTERPYTGTELATLVEEIGDLRRAGVPRGKLRAVYEVLFQDPMRAQFDALLLKERLHATGALKTGPLAELVGKLRLFPFREREDGAWTTPWSELVELYDFVPAPPSAPTTENPEEVALDA